MIIWLVHFVLAVLLAETLVLAVTRRVWLRELAPHLLAGLALLLALRSALSNEPPWAIAAWLAAAGVAHGSAVWRYIRRRSTT